MADETKPPAPPPAPGGAPADKAADTGAPNAPAAGATPARPAPVAGAAPAAPAAPKPAAPAAPKPAAPAAPKAAAPAAPARPAAPPAPAVDLAGKTTTAAATAAKVSSRDPDDSSPLVTRRVWLGMAWGAFSAASAAALAATGRFMFPNVLNEPPQQFKVGLPSDFGMGVDERFKESNGVWIVRTNDDIVHRASGFYVLNTTCTHLGCTPNFLAAESKFKCPCHGSGFRPTGINFEGPAPRPLERNRIVLAEDGQILIDKSRKFQFELGQWIDPDAFLRI
jgi:cytochrome b6-f complex iron-sulfur subunit